MLHFFSPNSGGDLRSDAHQSQIIGGDADVDHTQIIGRDTVKLLGGYIPPSLPGFGTPAREGLSSERLFLASRGSVLGKAVLGLGFFLCPWPWPPALCSRLHLCSEPDQSPDVSSN